MDELKRTVFFDLHSHFGARFVPFAGYQMPVQYAPGVMKEHLHTRAAAGLFDVSHMGQITLHPLSGRIGDAALALESLVPVDVLGLPVGRQRYGLFTAPDGGILDDLMIANRGDHLLLVVNAACVAADLAHLQAHLSDRCAIRLHDDRVLVAIQGPAAEAALAALNPAVRQMRFMDLATLQLGKAECWLSRSGYTGEDGFEISIPAQFAVEVVKALWSGPADVQPIGLGARDSLRLEAGMCLYGHDIDPTTDPVEAALEWAIQKVRRSGGARAGGFPGAERILAALQDGALRRRVGLLPEGRAPMREGTQLYQTESGGAPIGAVTSGGFGPSLDRPIAMGYLPAALAAAGTRVFGDVRGKRLPALVAAMPFIQTSYKR